MNDVKTLSSIDKPVEQIDQTAQEVAETEYHRAKELDRIAAAERVARLLLSDDDPDGVCPV